MSTRSRVGALEPHDARRRDVITNVIGLLLIGGVFADGWAHFNRPGLETFFTPWHAVLYSALGVMVGWLVLVAWRSSGGAPRRALAELPRGYGLAVLGAGIFAVGGLADLGWHELFGIEVAVDALVSPTHLLLGAGGVLILGTGMRSQGVLGTSAARPWSAPAVASLLLTLAVVVFFLLYTSAFAAAAPVEQFTPTPESGPGHEAAEQPVIAALSAYLVTTVVIILPVLALANQPGRPPAGTSLLVVATVSLLAVVVVGLPTTELAGALGAIAGAAAYELLAWKRSISVGPHGGWLGPSVLVALIWSGQMVAFALVDALRWPVSLWAGVVVLSSFLAGVTAFVSARQSVAQATRADLSSRPASSS